MSDRTTSEVAVHNRMSLPEFRAGKEGPSIFSAGTMNIFSRTLRALTNPRIVWGEKDDAQITDGNFLISLSRTSAMGGGIDVIPAVVTDASAGDYFLCKQVVSTIGDSGVELLASSLAVHVAKPYNLRMSVFDRDVLNATIPGNIGTTDEITCEMQVESWDGITFSSATKKFSYEYKSSTFRIATDETDANPDNWTSENQTIIPRFVPAQIDETGLVTNPCTLLYIVNCSTLDVFFEDQRLNYLALNDGWAWMRTT